MRQPLHISIDPSYNHSSHTLSHTRTYTHGYAQGSTSSSPSSSSAHEASPSNSNYGTSATSPASTLSDGILCSVLCMYDFSSSDSTHLSFFKNEILDIIKKEDSGWWAAMRKGGDVVGWIPQAFVKSLTEEMAERLWNVREELRVYEYEAEQLYLEAPTSRIPLFEDDEPAPPPSSQQRFYNSARSDAGGSNYRPQKDGWRTNIITVDQSQPQLQPMSQTTSQHNSQRPNLYTSPSQSQLTPTPTSKLVSINKPTPPTPTDPDITVTSPQTGTVPRRPLPIVGVTTTSASTSRDPIPGPVRSGSVDNAPSGSPDTNQNLRSDAKIKQLTGSEEALDFYKANLVWYLKPRYGDQLVYSGDEGQAQTHNGASPKLLSGTRIALVEKLVWSSPTRDPIKSAEDTAYRRVFLTTFRTFMSADALFETLVDFYRMEPPRPPSSAYPSPPYPSSSGSGSGSGSLTDAEYEEWREKCLLPTQKLVLTLFTMWLEDHRLLEEEPHIAGRLTEFVKGIYGPDTSASASVSVSASGSGSGPGSGSDLASMARGIFSTIERLTFASPSTNSTGSPVRSPRNRRGRGGKPKNGDLLRLDSSDIAEQLTLMEWRLYGRITVVECLGVAFNSKGKGKEKSSKGCPPRENNGLTNFCGTHDKLAAWVTSTILNNEQLSRRADTVDFWIKVAEKCRNLSNFASMSAIINALSSTVIMRLHLTWAHVGRKSTLDQLLKYNKPTGGFSSYRRLQLQAEGPCVPFVGMYLTEIVHVKDSFEDEDTGDEVHGEEGKGQRGGQGKVSFIQRHRWYEIVKVMLRSQNRPYGIAENESTMAFIQNNLRIVSGSSSGNSGTNANGSAASSSGGSGGAVGRDWQSKFWAKSQEVQQSELAHADIRRGLEAAGF